MKKILNILLTIVLIGTICLVGFLIVGILVVQDKHEPRLIENEPEMILIESGLKKNNSLDKFFENPIDLKELKKNRSATTTVINGKEYYFYPEINDSIFYSYNFMTEDIDSKRINEISVFKYGKNKHKYEDETEILIEISIFNKDPYLGEANFIGFPKKQIEEKFGSEFIALDNQIIYTVKNKALIFEFDDFEVKSFRYLNLNTETIDSDLIKRIKVLN
ncbi:MAG: hypothetical protein ABJL44_14800 [Algibacter sp.]